MNDKIEITENAQKHIAKVISQDKASYFRISVQGGGCAGFQYKFDFESNKNDDDIVFKTEKISVVIDATSLGLIKGSKIDYVNELIGSSFTIVNPQASSACGCGTSFSI
jgi:iron-sulfur cluster insertion protein